MKQLSHDYSSEVSAIEQLLNEKSWTSEGAKGAFKFFLPPKALGFEGRYSIALPSDTLHSGAGGLLVQAVQSLKDIYGGTEINEYLDRLAGNSFVSASVFLTVRFQDDLTQKGSMPLSAVADFLKNWEAGLYKGAAFKLGHEDKATEQIAKEFVKSSHFLQTEKGSFIARVEIPHRVLRQADLFGLSALPASEVCSSFFSAIDFLNTHILRGSEDFSTNESLSEALTLFDVELLETLQKLLLDSEMHAIEFQMLFDTQKRTTATGYLTPEKTMRLNEYVKFVKDYLRSEKNIEIQGEIVELRSRDPSGNRNYIKVVSKFHGDTTYISATLSNDQYTQANAAHLSKRKVTIKGDGMRMKTQIRMQKVTSFNV
jgi:hypothetical protein